MITGVIIDNFRQGGLQKVLDIKYCQRAGLCTVSTHQASQLFLGSLAQVYHAMTLLCICYAIVST